MLPIMNRSALVFTCLVFAALQVLGCKTSETPPPPQPEKKLDPKQLQTRNNAAALLFDLLIDEKNVSKLFILKGGRDDLKQLVRSISKATGDGADKLKAMAKADPTLDLELLALPKGEVQTREAIAKTTKDELLGTSGAELESNLLLSQANALRYGSHLATVAASNSSRKNQIDEFKALSATLENLYKQVVAMMRSPAK
jgi:hypothetical protein